MSRAYQQARAQETTVGNTADPTKVAAAPTTVAAATAAPPAQAARPIATGTGRGHVRQMVEMVRTIAHAAHALHEAGVVHRDIKPGNIMLTADGVHPVLMDLGLAQLAEETDGRLTRTRQFVGTLRYASPEQVLAAGRVDRRTDVYSLGATLWELLTLRPLHGAGDDMPTPELMLKIQSHDVEKPRTYNRHVPRDLQAIVMKCLEKDRGRRYPTAADLAADLGRFLNGEPVVAQPPSFRYLAGKFTGRHKLPLATAATLVVLALVGVVAAFIQIDAERNDAVAAQGREENERKKAEKALADLEHSRKEADVVWNVVDQAYSQIDQDKIRHLPGLSPVHEELASIRLQGMVQLARLTPDDPTVEPKVARAHAILGSIRSHVGSFQRARENLEKAAEIYSRLAEKSPDNKEYRLQQCRATNDLAWLYWDDNRKSEVRRLSEQTLSLLEAELARNPQDPAVRYEIAVCLLRLGGALPDDAAQQTREKLATRATEIFEQLIQQKHREVDARAGLAVATYRLTWAQFDGKDQQFLLAGVKKVLALDEVTRKLEPSSPYLSSGAVLMQGDLASRLVQLGKLDEALAQQKARLALARETVKRSPNTPRHVAILAQALSDIALEYRRSQRTADAQAAYDECNHIMDGLLHAFLTEPMSPTMVAAA